MALAAGSGARLCLPCWVLYLGQPHRLGVHLCHPWRARDADPYARPAPAGLARTASSPCSSLLQPPAQQSTFPSSDSACPGRDSSPVNNQSHLQFPLCRGNWYGHRNDRMLVGSCIPPWCLIPLCPDTKRRENRMFFWILLSPAPEMQRGDKKKGGRKGRIPVSVWSWANIDIYSSISTSRGLFS